MATTSFLSPQLDSLIKLALAGDTYAQNRLGDLYREGDDVEQNYSEALKWYQRAADKGDANGQNNVGSMYLNGIGTEPNHEKAVKYYRLAAEQDLPIALYNLGLCFKVGKGVSIDLSEAASWLERAAKAGDAYAQNDWGAMLRFGIGVGKNIVEAAYWFIQAAEQNDLVALGNLHDIADELEIVAKSGNKRAQKYIAKVLKIQKRFETDPSEASKYLAKFTGNGTSEEEREKGESHE